MLDGRRLPWKITPGTPILRTPLGARAQVPEACRRLYLIQQAGADVGGWFGVGKDAGPTIINLERLNARSVVGRS
jgi:hypothetical protein